MKGNNMKTAIKGILIMMLLGNLVAGCQNTTAQPIQPETIKPAATSPSPPLKESAEMTNTATFTGTTTNAVEETIIETPGNIIPTLIGKLTLTPIATLSTSSREEKLQELLSTNLGCKLPCYWGMMPGETTWEVAQEFLAPFANEILSGDFGYFKENGLMVPKATTAARFKVAGYPKELVIDFLVSNRTITEISVDHDTNKIRYSLDKLLAELGQPEEILMALEPETPSGKPFYVFHLYYPTAGVMASYEGEAERTGGTIKYCPTEVTPRLRLYPPGSITLKEMIGIYFDPPGFVVPSLEEYSGMSSAEFYIQMVKPGSCFSVEE